MAQLHDIRTYRRFEALLSAKVHINQVFRVTVNLYLGSSLDIKCMCRLKPHELRDLPVLGAPLRAIVCDATRLASRYKLRGLIDAIKGEQQHGVLEKQGAITSSSVKKRKVQDPNLVARPTQVPRRQPLW